MASAKDLLKRIGRPVRLMEVCGTHTVSGFRTGLRSILPEGLTLISGPGCPVCVTPDRYVDRAAAISREADTVVATFGDMMRVPGSGGSLERARAEGGRVQVVYSPLDALALARKDREMRVVFAGVGFETTTPTVAWTMRAAAREGVANFQVLCAHKTIPEAMSILAAMPGARIDGFLCPGHVSVVIGFGAYEGLCRRHRVPCVVAGFEAADMAGGIRMLLEQISEGRADVENAYGRSVTRDGNREAQEAVSEVFEPCDAEWRGLGVISGTGLRIREAFRDQDADRSRPDDGMGSAPPRSGCRCGEILTGQIPPRDCALFGSACTPASPVGPCMVSSEGTCAAYYKYDAWRGA